MRFAKMCFFCALSLNCLVTAAGAAEIHVDPEQSVLLLATRRSSTMADEIRLASGLGFRLLMGAPTQGDEFAYLLERTDRNYASDYYRLLATKRLKTMESELNQGSREGYRLVPRSVVWPECDELMLVMERTAREDPVYAYLVLGTHRTSTLQREVSQAIEAGYAVVAMQGGNENVVILERELERFE